MSLRLKERGGGGGKIVASRPVKPLPESTPKEKGVIARIIPAANGKENPRVISGGKLSAGRPNLVPKLAERPAASSTAAAAASTAVRWSTSSMPRGKAPNPSDFSRLVSGLRCDHRGPRVSGWRTIEKDLDAEARGRKSLGGSKGLDKIQQGKGVLGSNSKQKVRILVSGNRVLEKCKTTGKLDAESAVKDPKVLDSTFDKVVDKTLNFAGGSVIAGEKEEQSSKLQAFDAKRESGGKEILANSKLDICKEKILMTSKSTLSICDFVVELTDDTGDKCKLIDTSKPQIGMPKRTVDAEIDRPKIDNLASHIEGLDKVTGCVDKGVLNHEQEIGEKKSEKIRVFAKENEETKGVVVNKCPSKLREKLAMLEGKVQKIASEIKRTKEMLEHSNPDESKLILTDIQHKLSGIEKAVGHVMDGTKVHMGSSEKREVDCLQHKTTDTGLIRKTDDSKRPVKGLSNEELEARFFPHNILLRSRRTSCAAGGSTEIEDDSQSAIDDNPIALEFLASLSADQVAVGKNSGTCQSQCSSVWGKEIQNASSAAQHGSRNHVGGCSKEEVDLLSTEKFEELDEQENKPAAVVQEAAEETCEDQLREIGPKSSTGGWFVSEGEAVLLAHDDGSCSYYDIANYEVKSEYKPPAGVSTDLWRDCWLIRATGPDGCSGRYIVAASAGNTLDSGFCCWDFYTREVKAFHVEEETPNSSSSSSRTVLGPLPNTGLLRRSTLSSVPATERKQWWYRPCGPLLISAATRQKTLSAYDIRDGELVMKWGVSNPVVGMEYSSPIQWRSRGKVVVATTEAISLWDVNTLNPQQVVSVGSAAKRVYALHVNNTDAELGGGVRQRVSSSEVEGNDGVFCTQESISILDFRHPTGIGLRMSRHGATPHSVFSRGDLVFTGSTEGRLSVKGGPHSQVQQYSIRKGKAVATYEFPESNSHFHHCSVTQVWGDSGRVMGICGLGLFVFDASKDEGLQVSNIDGASTIGVKEIIGPDDLYCPSFDYLGSRVLIVSRDRPAFWRYLF